MTTRRRRPQQGERHGFIQNFDLEGVPKFSWGVLGGGEGGCWEGVYKSLGGIMVVECFWGCKPLGKGTVYSPNTAGE